MPHFDGGEIAQTITFRLGDALPRAVIERWKGELERETPLSSDAVLRKRIEAYLDHGYGACSLRDTRVAAMVETSFLQLTPQDGWPLSRIVKDMKSFTSREVNKLLGRRGQFWMEDYFDRYVRDAKHFANAVAYIENNPVKAGLVKTAREWGFSSARFRESC